MATSTASSPPMSPSQPSAKPRPALVRKDTFTRRALSATHSAPLANLTSSPTSSSSNAKSANNKTTPNHLREEYDEDGWYIYRGHGQVRNKKVTRIKVILNAGLTQIPDKAFYGCAALTTVLITEPDPLTHPIASSTTKSTTGTATSSSSTPAALTSIGQFAFYECTKLAELQLPNSITNIGEYAFSGCSTLTTLQLPQALQSIDEGTFSDCPSLTSVLLPDRLTSIGLYAFYGCFSLINILLPASVKSIGEEAFEGCQALVGLCDPGLTLKEWLRLRYFNLPLHRLCYLPGITDLEVLVFKKQIDIVDGSAMNPLHILALNPSAALDTTCTLDMITSMLSNSSNKQQLVSAKDQQGRTPVHYACLNPYVTLTMIVAMVDRSFRQCLATRDKTQKYPTALAMDFHRPLEIQQWLYRYQPVQAKDLRFPSAVADKMIREMASQYLTDLIVKKASSLGRSASAFPPEEQHGWVQFVSQLQDDDLIHRLVDFIRESERSTAKALAHAQDYHRQVALQVAVPGVKEALQAALLFCGRYDLEEGEPRYQTTSSLVSFGRDMKVGALGGSPVAIKFFRNKDQFETERHVRMAAPPPPSSSSSPGGGNSPVDTYHPNVFSSPQAHRFDSEYVIPMVASYHGDHDPTAHLEAVKSEVPPYFIVLEQAERNLSEALLGENLTARPLSVCSTLYELAQCLHHVHSCGYLHGDVKPRNIVRQKISEHDKRWKLIDLDGAVELGKALTGKERSTAYMPPELVKVENKEPVWVSGAVAHASIDVWSFGVIMYQLVTEKVHLWGDGGVDWYDQLDKAGLKKLANWDSGDVKEKLAHVNAGPARDLLTKLLNKKPDKRPSMDEVLEDAFFAPMARLSQLKALLKKAHAEDNTSLVTETKRDIKDLNQQLKEWNEGPLEKRPYFQDFFFRGGCPPASRTRRPSIGPMASGEAMATPGETLSPRKQRSPPPSPSNKRGKPRISRRASTGGPNAPVDYWPGGRPSRFRRPSISLMASSSNHNNNNNTNTDTTTKGASSADQSMTSGGTQSNGSNHSNTNNNESTTVDGEEEQNYKRRFLRRRRKSVF